MVPFWEGARMRRAFSRAGHSALALTVVGVGAFCLGRLLPASNCAAQGPAPAPSSAGTGDPGKRVVAYIYDTIPITREELGEYLIQRYGPEKLDLLVNKRIIEKVCAEQGIEVTAAEIEAGLQDDLKGVSVNKADFVNRVLAQYHKTLYEWKEDVVRPRLLLTKLCRQNVKIFEEDIRNQFESEFGEKVDCRALIYPESELKSLEGERYQKIRSSDAEFDHAARNQPLPGLALTGGQIKPVSHHSGAENVEKVAFSLQPGEVSEMIQTPQGILILKCIQRIPPDTTHKLDDERERIIQVVTEKKLEKEIPNYFKTLRASAKPIEYMKPQDTEKDLRENVEKTLKETAEPGKKGG
jgi:hypothetical protein